MSPPDIDGQPTALPRSADGFQIERELGRGGMGVVYLAVESSSGRRLALKVLPQELTVSAETFERFRREAITAASISDSRCVFVYGAHQFEGSPAISMEFVDGQTLDQRIKSGEPVPVRTAVRWTIELLEGLEAAHRAGVIHRDVKPSNCFLTRDGHVKVGDFGLSRSLERDVQLTQSGAFLGSPLYAPPEQIKGREVDQRSDMYSAAATLYALLTGHPPYRGNNIGEVLARILSEPPESPRTLRSEIPSGLERVLLRAMEREPDKRWSDLATFRAELHPYSLEAESATRLRRFAAYMLDTLVTTVFSAITSGVLVLVSPGYRQAVTTDPKDPPLFVVAASMVLIAAYFGLCEGLWGRTVGKWLLGLRVVAAATGEVSFLRALLRSLLYILPSFVAVVGVFMTHARVVETQLWLSIAPWAVHALYFVSARRSNHWRALHDLATGMRVVQMPLPFHLGHRRARLADRKLEPATTVPELIASCRVRGIVGRTPLGPVFEGEDPLLARRVWMFAYSEGQFVPSEARRQLVRGGRVNWLSSAVATGQRFEIFEAPGGDSLLAWVCAQREVTWLDMLRLLYALSEELALWETGARVAIEQLWIDRSGNLRVLDLPFCDEDRIPRPLAPLELLRSAAQALLPARSVFPPSAPGRAEPVFERILGSAPSFASIAEARDALGSLRDAQSQVRRRTRTIQLGLTGAALFMVAAIGSLIVMLSAAGPMMSERVNQYCADLRQGTYTRTDTGAVVPLSEEDRRARQILLVSFVNVPGVKITSTTTTDDAGNQAVLDEIHKLFPSVSVNDSQWAAKHIHDSASVEIKDFDTKAMFQHGRKMAVELIAGWCAIALLFTFLLRGGITLSMFGLRVRDRRGRRASRSMCVGRALIVWSPLLLSIPAIFLVPDESATGFLVLAGLALLLVVGAAFAVGRPARGLPDLLLRTRLVPR